PAARPARQPPAADREYGALSLGGIRSGGRSFLREPERGRSQRRGASGIRARVDLWANPADDLPARERFRPAVGAGLQQTALHQLLEVSRYRSRAAEVGPDSSGRGAPRRLVARLEHNRTLSLAGSGGASEGEQSVASRGP